MFTKIDCFSFDISTRRASILCRRFLMLMLLAMVGVGLQVAHGASNPNCTLIVPQKPLSASGLATPFQLTVTNREKGSCHESNPSQAAFVQAAILDPATGNISIYAPLVIDKGATPAKKPVTPTLPPNAVVGLWFGYNGDTLTLKGSDDLNLSKCVNGVKDSEFGQFAYCNAVAFFNAAHKAISAGQLKIPPIGISPKDGKACPTVRDFFVVDQDQSDNLPTTYLLSKDGRMAQNTQKNLSDLVGAKVLTNASDNRLVNVALAKVLGCQPWKVPDLADNGAMVPALPLNELQARAFQKSLVALIPAGDPMVMTNGLEDLDKLNAYRRGVDQPTVSSLRYASTDHYCGNLLRVTPARFIINETLLRAASSPDPTKASNLFAFMAKRFVDTDSILHCTELELNGKAFPVVVIRDSKGIATDAIIY
jgi:hypothetical protein